MTALDHLRTHGVTVLTDAAEPDLIAAARRELVAVAHAEREAGTAILEDGSASDGHYRPGRNQRIVALLGKGESFRRLALAPAVLSVVRDLLGSDTVLLSSVTANIANPGGQAMALHADQGFVPPSTQYAVLANAIWPLVEFTAANGATRVVPGSHRDGATGEAEAVVAPAGTVVLLDGRTVHGTGCNATDAPRPAVIVTYCLPWVWPFANHLLDLDPDTVASLSDELLGLLGCRPWYVHGYSEQFYLERLAAG
jgi:ectoine hydroxylase-related dioxygenase (phytanoyl-CoA dioxygenase family)